MLAQIETAGQAQQATATSAENSHRVEYDVMTDVIRVTATGFWSPDELRANMRKTASVLDRVRGARRQVRVLVDLREAHIQSQETVDRIRAGTGQIYRPDERVALIVTPGIASLQARRFTSDTGNQRLFATIEAAEAWLFA